MGNCTNREMLKIAYLKPPSHVVWEQGPAVDAVVEKGTDSVLFSTSFIYGDKLKKVGERE